MGFCEIKLLKQVLILDILEICCKIKVRVWKYSTEEELANIKSQIKRNKQNQARRLRNRVYRGSARTYLRKAMASINAEDLESPKLMSPERLRRLTKLLAKVLSTRTMPRAAKPAWWHISINYKHNWLRLVLSLSLRRMERGHPRFFLLSTFVKQLKNQEALTSKLCRQDRCIL